ncbi:hypothetical protein ACK2M7_04165 [Chryseobacterium sp. TY4]
MTERIYIPVFKDLVETSRFLPQHFLPGQGSNLYLLNGLFG